MKKSMIRKRYFGKEEDKSSGQPRPDLSVIICTKDRCDLLKRTLLLLAEQSIPAGKTFEIIVVDNNSRDPTRRVVEEFQNSSNIPTTYILEKKVGLSRARNTGFAASRADIVVFTDDDMIFPKNWLGGILGCFSLQPQPASVTGPVEVHVDSHPALHPSLANERKRYRHPTDPWEIARGNNMAFLRSILEKAGPFDTRLGAGTPAGSGEDTDMVYRVLKLGGEILFEPDLNVYHDHKRQEPEAVARICRNYAVGGVAFLVKHIARLDIFALELLYWKLRSLRRSLKRADQNDTCQPPRRLIRRIYIRGYLTGILLGILNLFKKI